MMSNMGQERRPSRGDDLERRPVGAPRVAGSGNPGLPVEEGKAPSLETQRDALLVQIDELAGTLRFMGLDHPKRADTERQLAQVRLVLQQLEKAIGQGSGGG